MKALIGCDIADKELRFVQCNKAYQPLHCLRLPKTENLANDLRKARLQLPGYRPNLAVALCPDQVLSKQLQLPVVLTEAEILVQVKSAANVYFPGNETFYVDYRVLGFANDEQLKIRWFATRQRYVNDLITVAKSAGFKLVGIDVTAQALVRGLFCLHIIGSDAMVIAVRDNKLFICDMQNHVLCYERQYQLINQSSANTIAQFVFQQLQIYLSANTATIAEKIIFVGDEAVGDYLQAQCDVDVVSVDALQCGVDSNTIIAYGLAARAHQHAY